jgi:hypothetical protein
MTTDSFGNVLFCDALTNTIRKYWISSKTITTIAGGGALNGFASGDKEGYGYLSLIMAPIDIVLDEYDNVYFTDGNQFVINVVFNNRKSGVLIILQILSASLLETDTATKMVIFPKLNSTVCHL